MVFFLPQPPRRQAHGWTPKLWSAIGFGMPSGSAFSRPDSRRVASATSPPYEDDQGRFADFHALRHTFISNLARAGVHSRNAQALARHSTIDLTMNVYTHVDMDDLAGEVENLPAVLGGGKADEPGEAEEAEAVTIPPDLADLAGNWAALPEHVRKAIAALAAG